MADDLNTSYQYPFPQPSEESVRFRDGAIDGRPAGVPSSYDEGGSTRWTPEAISEVHALAQLGRYQVRGVTGEGRRSGLHGVALSAIQRGDHGLIRVHGIVECRIWDNIAQGLGLMLDDFYDGVLVRDSTNGTGGKIVAINLASAFAGQYVPCLFSGHRSLGDILNTGTTTTRTTTSITTTSTTTGSTTTPFNTTEPSTITTGFSTVSPPVITVID